MIGVERHLGMQWSIFSMREWVVEKYHQQRRERKNALSLSRCSRQYYIKQLAQASRVNKPFGKLSKKSAAGEIETRKQAQTSTVDTIERSEHQKQYKTKYCIIGRNAQREFNWHNRSSINVFIFSCILTQYACAVCCVCTNMPFASDLLFSQSVFCSVVVVVIAFCSFRENVGCC